MHLDLDTTFTPFTYEEMVAPLRDYKKAYDEKEAAYSDLVTQTEAWADIANREKSPEAYKMYMRYSSALNRAVDDFSQGMTAKNSKALLGLKRDYAREITPIAKASEALDKAMQFRQEKGPDAVFEVEDYNSLDSFLHGQKANNKYILKSDVMKETAAITEAAMREVAKDPEFKKVMGNQYWQIVQHSGGSWADYEAAMKQAIGSNPILNNKFSQIKSDMLKKYDYNKYGAAGQQKIANAIDLGMAIGLDKETTTFQANQGFSVGGRGGGGRSYSRSGGGGGYYSKSKKDKEEDDEDDYTYTYGSDVLFYGTNNQVGILKPGAGVGYNYCSYDKMKKDAKMQFDAIYGDDIDPDQYNILAWKVKDGNIGAQKEARGRYAFKLVSKKKTRKRKENLEEVGY